VVELGAGLGIISTLCAKKVGGDKVFAYEANPQMIPLIRDTYRLNGVQSIYLKNCILGEKDGEATFYLHEDFWRSSTVPFAPADSVRVPVVNASEELDAIKPSFLICDIEGGEFDLFKTLSYPMSLTKILIEVHPQGGNEVDRLLADFYAAGFTLIETVGVVWILTRE
jgi:FkbM family methyltransferase